MAKKAETQESDELQKNKTRLTVSLNTKVDNVIKTTLEKVDKNYAEVMAIQPKEAGNALSQALTKTMSDMDFDIRKSLRIEGVPHDPENAEAKIFVPKTEVLSETPE